MDNLAISLKKRPFIIGASIVALLVIIIVAAVLMLRQPSRDDYELANGKQLQTIESARKRLAPAVNEYLAAWKKAFNESKSIDEATKTAKPQYDAYKKAETKADEAIVDLNTNRAANNNETGTAIRQLTDDFAAEAAYFTGLVEAYPQYAMLFAEKSACSGIFIGQSDTLTDRKQRLGVAAKDCYEALDELKKTSNVTYVDYAKKIERRVKQMQVDATATAQGEADLKKFNERLPEFQKKYADATARNASEDELLKLAGEINKVNAEIKDSKARFEFAAKRYIANVKEMPILFQNVYGNEVPAKLEAYGELYKVRTTVLKLILQDKLDS